MFTQYKYSTTQVSEAALEAAGRLATLQPGVNPVAFAAQAVAERLRAKPETYLQYGPYWWAVKAALRACGQDFGRNDEALIRAEYGDGLPGYAAIVAGEQFRDYYNSHFLAGAAQFWLDDQGEQSYVLFDMDMEIRILGGDEPLRVAAELQAEEVSEDEAAPVLDGVAPLHSDAPAPQMPFAVRFEHDAVIWKANVFAADGEAAYQKVKAWQTGGAMGRAINSQSSAMLDGVALCVDHDERIVIELAG